MLSHVRIAVYSIIACHVAIVSLAVPVEPDSFAHQLGSRNTAPMFINPGDTIHTLNSQLDTPISNTPTIALNTVNVNVPIYMSKALVVGDAQKCDNKSITSQHYSLLFLSIIMNLMLSAMYKKYHYRGVVQMLKDIIAALILILLKLVGGFLAINRQSYRPLALMYGGAAPASDD
ncbi:hypothetical protein PENSPDRAFT_50932 [Peniophora sp. CONT]|nr:hypothetical protein PENSPDRAFT_50932 [Peniophora sp. CONT]